MAVSSHTHLIFVYGTLLRGQNNYSYWLADPAEATFVSTATTADRYPLFVNLLPDHPGCSPCVLDKPNYGSEDRCFHVSGELFLVSDRMLAWLNVLEGIADGVYTASPITVVMGQLPHSLEVKGQDHLHTLLAPFHLNTNNNNSNSNNNNNKSLYIPNQTTLKALIYFRSKSFPADWDTPSPRSCSTLLRSFSQEAMLNAYGKRFNGLPAHMQSADAAREMHAELQALPIAHRPQLESCTLGAPIAPKPIVLFIIDGVGDNTYTELGNRTPLEAVAGCPPRQCAAEPTLGLPAAAAHAFTKGDASTASTCDDADIPSEWASAHSSAVSLGINTVTAAGVSGLMDPYMAGQSCGSDTAHLSMFGYPPTTYYRGRGAYEALGAGLVLEDEDIAFKSNFATFADPTENGFGDEDPEQEALAPADGQRQYVTHRRCDREFRSEGPVLSAALHGTRVAEDLEGKPFDYAHEIHVRYATEHRCGVALTGAQTLPDGCVVGMLSDKITGTDCLKDGRYLRRCEPTVDESHDEYQSAVYTCRLVEAASARITDILRQHPINEARRAHNRRVGAEGGNGGGERKNVANLVLFRGAAKKGWVPTFAVRHGLSGLMVAPTCIIKGLGLCCGLQDTVCRACYPDAESQREALKAATGDVHSDLSVKVDAVLHALRLSSNHPHCTHGGDCGSSNSYYQQHYGFIVLHVKGVDDAGHDGSLHEKMDMLQKCGAAMARLWEALPAGATMAVVADHSTPLAVGDHCCEPVPVSIAVKQGGGKESPLGDGVRRYGEVDAAGGALRRFRGEALIPTMKRMHAHYHYE